MGCPSKIPSPGSVKVKATIAFKLVTPLVKRILSAETGVAGWKYVFNRLAMAARRRLGPKGPS